jgi:AbrB family looped-hinge helix DNA binding protein
METIMKISPQGQVRIPKKIMESLGLETGDYIAMDIENNQILLKPRKLIDPSQGWHWTKSWQEKEAEADKELVQNELSPEFRNAQEGIKWLKE